MSTAVLHRKNKKAQQLSFQWAEAEVPHAQSNLSTLPKPLQAWPTQRKQPAQARSSAPALSPDPLNKHRRVGQVAMGSVLLALLKQYGITDEEIRAELSPAELSTMMGGAI